jgi:hypothetical protein
MSKKTKTPWREFLQAPTGCLHRSRAHFAVLFVADGDPNSRETDEDIHYPLDRRPRAEDEVYNVPIGAGKTADANKAPIEPADYQKDKRDHMKRFHIF